MVESRTERLAPLTGVVFVFLMVAGALLVNNYTYLPPPSDLAEFFGDNATRLQIAAYLGAPAGAFLIWFAGSVRQSLRPFEGGNGRLSAVAFGGGAAAGVLVAASFSILGVAAARGGSSSGISAEAAGVLYDVYGSLGGQALPVTLAVLIGAGAVVSFRTGAWPRWLAWVSALLAVGSLSPVAYIFVGIDLLWVVVVSILLYLRRGDTMPA